MPVGVYKKTEEHKRKLSLANMGKLFHGKLNSFKGHKHTLEAKEKNRLAHLGKKQSLESSLKKSLKLKGKKRPPFSEEWKKKQSLAHRDIPRFDLRGSNHPNWQGGVWKSASEKVRKSIEYRLWRTSVFERDNFTCRFCGIKGGVLRADHIKPFALFPELRFAIDNGRTLCDNCHKKTDTYGRNLKK